MNGVIVAGLQSAKALVEVVDDPGEEVLLAMTASHMLRHGIVGLGGFMFMAVPCVLNEARADEWHD